MNIFGVKYDNMLIPEKLCMLLRKVGICLRYRPRLRFTYKTMSRTSTSYLISCKTLSGTEASILNYM
ncbi:hypothetical protein F383_31082 [Gossypium arboreum]|uniref:Uncharacterized protein n=1 Tax=Gossypium arboreum TaxID=29729 RepID=A0A0B0PKY0_GOSAR|nr:hypothetical protein F383_31082 [Gossypium arboreum]